MSRKSLNSPKFDFSVPLGLIGAFAFIALGISLYTSVGAFINTPSLLIVFGGTLCAGIVCFSPSDVAKAFAQALRLILAVETKKMPLASLIMRASDITHTNGLLSLQKNYMKTIPEKSFWANGLNLLIDGINGTECEQIMRSKMMNEYAQRMNSVAFFNKLAEIAPAMGLIGTLIGLVQMLSTLSDPSTIGPAMAVAMLTTFYGAIFAYLLCIPLASRLEKKAHDILAENQLCLVGFKAIDKGQNPRKTQMELNALLPSGKHINYFES